MYRELVELKGLMREKKVTYENLAEHLKMSISAFSNKINGKSVFSVSEANAIIMFLDIPKEKIYVYFF